MFIVMMINQLHKYYSEDVCDATVMYG